ncbi:uncharacterized protein ACNS7B_013762 isoform 1-T1 [Menidia menidia]
MGQGGKQMCETDAVRPKTAVQLPLAGSTVTVSKRDFLRLNRSGMTIFSQELAVLGFTKQGLAHSTLTGKSWRGDRQKHSLMFPKCRLLQMLFFWNFCRQVSLMCARPSDENVTMSSSAKKKGTCGVTA